MNKEDINKRLQALLADLPDGVAIERYDIHRHTIELFITWNEPGRFERVCPKCGSTWCVKKDGGATQTIRHLRTGTMTILITFHKPRFMCKSCGRTFYMKPNLTTSNMSISDAVKLEIIVELTSTTKCVKQIAKDTGTSAAIVYNVMKHLKPMKPSYLPVTLGIDEFHGKTGTYNRDTGKFDVEKYHCVVTDADGGFVMDILYKATHKYLHEYFMEYPLDIRKKVRYYCTDMRSGFSRIARECFPNAIVCIDKFHVVKLITKGVDTVRIDAWRRLAQVAEKAAEKAAIAKTSGDEDHAARMELEVKIAKDNATLMKSAQKVLITSPYKTGAYWNKNPAKRDERLKNIFHLEPDLKIAREALLEFYRLVRTENHAIRRTELNDWIQTYSSCNVPPIRSAVETINKHRKGIENAWRYGKSNGPTEGLNKKIKDVRRMAYGAHKFENFRTRAILACGSTTVNRDTFTIFREKNSSAPGREDDHNNE